jgi:hypothetical protein
LLDVTVTGSLDAKPIVRERVGRERRRQLAG